MDSSLRKKQKMDDLEVIGVSRSGRVRKKSSKLMDFESPDEIDRPYKKQPAATRKLAAESANFSSDLQPKKDVTQQQRHVLKMEEDVKLDDQFRDDPNDSNTSDYEANDPYSNRSHTMSTDSLDSESDLDTSANTSQAIGGSTPGGITQFSENGQFQKLTDTNDSMIVGGPSMQIQGGRTVDHLGQQDLVQAKNKRLVIKDGRIVSRSSNQGGKGPGPLRKAASQDKTDRSRPQHTTTPAPSSALHQTNKKHSSTITTSNTSKPFSTTSNQRNRSSTSSSHHQMQSPTNKSPVYQLGLPTVGGNATMGASPPSPRPGVSTGHSKNDHMFKVNGIKPIDVAAHLKLLGESLTIIGERLKEHEGQIAVSGSLSVLLDSLLCALGPLLCLTQQVPELQENCCDPEQLTSTLDNVAFIMPGL